MPTSPYSHLPIFVDFLFDIWPKSILDIGLGNGKLGFIARDLLDVMYGERYKSCDWEIIIDGIEVFADYIQDHQRAIYNTIHIGDAFQVIDSLGMYDLIVMGDVLEHFTKENGLRMIEKCFAHMSKALALFVPLGDGWSQSAIYGNEYERHRSSWQQEEFEPIAKYFRVLEYKNIGYYGAYLITKEDYINSRIEALKTSPFAE